MQSAHGIQRNDVKTIQGCLVVPLLDLVLKIVKKNMVHQ
jgi:hypothetical protein